MSAFRFLKNEWQTALTSRPQHPGKLQLSAVSLSREEKQGCPRHKERDHLQSAEIQPVGQHMSNPRVQFQVI